jgi:YbgC/YbaW family acyl-CoA thioester hydrolase
MIPRYDILVREHHVDSLGHMNNSTYLALYEEARWELITSRGYGFHEVQRTQQAPIILEINLKFLKEITLREKVTITTEMLDYKGKIAHMRQQMLKTDGSVASEAILTFGLFDLKLRKLIEPTDAWTNAVGKV